MNFIKKNISNILFFGFILFLFTPYGLPIRVKLIEGLSYVKTLVFGVEIGKEERVELSSFNWKLITASGTEVNLEDFKGRVIIVNFWATWCPPCIAEMPSFQKLYDVYKQDVVFLFVTNDSAIKVASFLDKNKYNLPVYFETSTRPLEMNSNTLPTTYILNKEGEIVVDKGALDWNSNKVRKMLDGLLLKK